MIKLKILGKIYYLFFSNNISSFSIRKRVIYLNPNKIDVFIKILENMLRYIVIKILEDKFNDMLKFKPKINITLSDKYYAYIDVNNKCIFINLLCIVFDKHLIEYIIMHEILHFIIKSHGKLFNTVISWYYPYKRNIERILIEYNIYMKNLKELINKHSI